MPAGTMAMVSPAVSHRLPHVFADPERFFPDRFAASRQRGQATPLRPDRLRRRQARLHGQEFRLHAAQGDLDRSARSLRLRCSMQGFRDPNYGSWVTGPEKPCRGPLPPPRAAERLPMSEAASRRYDVAVVGAGPVGSVCALAHARKGARVALLEANPKASRRLAGEWLHPPAVRILRDLREIGIDMRCPAAPRARVSWCFPKTAPIRLSLPYPDESRGLVCDHATARLEAAGSDRERGRCRLHLPRRGSTRSRTDGSPFPSTAPIAPWTAETDRRRGRPGFDRAPVAGPVDMNPVLCSRMLGITMNEASACPSKATAMLLLGGPGPILIYALADDCVRVIVDIPPDRWTPRDRIGFLSESYAPDCCRRTLGPAFRRSPAGRAIPCGRQSV